jgi:hypothetical protein
MDQIAINTLMLDNSGGRYALCVVRVTGPIKDANLCTAAER